MDSVFIVAVVTQMYKITQLSELCDFKRWLNVHKLCFNKASES